MPGPDAAEAATRVAVRRAVADLDAGALVLVGCSGGADSVALAAAVAFVAPRSGLRAGAVVVDHGLQDGSAQVAADAAATCRALGLAPVDVRRVEVGARGGPEAAARAARTTALERAAREHGAVAVLLAHTLDDQAEQVLLALARGSGARSLAGIPAARGVYRRPFLGLRRSVTEAACRARGLTWWDDPTNGRPAAGAAASAAVTSATVLPLRSRVRADVLPVLEDVLGPGVPEALARSAAQLADDADLLDGLTAEVLERASRAATGAAPADGARPVVLDVEVLAAAHRALRTRALRRAAVAAGAPRGALAAAHVDSVDALVTRWRGQGPAHLPGPVLASRECGTLVLRAGPTPTHTPDPL
ncbi:tRNA lysidine(34) synthetase TilS [Luteimicrobium subarcticum]|uniref:tRNA(Ile)-lysidine synthase n=1 Tax=Luteimicrobium subarcticum TaxID=620910 RepID=A0A2M8WSQ5_9MICO|nr:tRNA lysidine(34) synthetase TilS [Luteimicrobium subarcticum]PJI93938.1 tRNA(Ile)-lysidine synthase [Luteimicrobium subarcticum]